MARSLDDMDLTVLYHALGANLSQGLGLFEAAFREAAADYRLEDIDALLNLLADPTLQDERRLAWHHYYTARKALLRWQPQEIEQALEKIEVRREDAPALQPRLELLRGQVQVMRGEWSAGLGTLKQVVSAARSAGEATLLAEAEEWTARAFIGRAQSCGGWAVPRDHGVAAWFRRALTIISLPLYAPILIYLGVTGAREFWQPALRYGADYSNWPIFIYYLRAFRALTRASQVVPVSDPDRALRLKVMQADLLRRLPAAQAAAPAYQELLDELPAGDVDYQAALLKHGLAQVLLDLHQVERAQTLLDEARTAYAELNDARAVAHVDLLLGDTAIRTGSPESALALWGHSLDVFEEQQDAVGLTEGLSRCYAVLESEVTTAIEDQVLALVRGVERQVFAVRLPNRLFDWIQMIGWAMPILVTLGLMIATALFIVQASRADMMQLAWGILSLRGVLVAGGVVLVAMIMNTLLGMVGLASTLWAEATRLDLIMLDKLALRRYDFAGRAQESMSWSAVETYLRVERGLWSRPTSTLSFDYLRDVEGQAMRLPGTTAWFEHLQREIEGHVGQSPQRYGLRWYGGTFIAFMGLIFALSSILIEISIPGVSGATHAWLALLLPAGSFLGIAYVMGNWILHYIRVGYQVAPASRFVPVASLLGVFLFGLGVWGRRILFPTHPLVIFWGVVMLFGLTHCLRRTEGGPSWRRPLATAVEGTVLVVGLGFVLRALLPVLLVVQAFTYSEAVRSLDPSQTGYEATRAEYFERIGQAGEWIVAVDPSFHQGYGYIGVTHYYQGDYKASVAAYTLDIRSGRSMGVLYCRALAYHALGDEASAARDLQQFLKYHTPGETPGCQSLFPETAGTFEIP